METGMTLHHEYFLCFGSCKQVFKCWPRKSTHKIVKSCRKAWFPILKTSTCMNDLDLSLKRIIRKNGQKNKVASKHIYAKRYIFPAIWIGIRYKQTRAVTKCDSIINTLTSSLTETTCSILYTNGYRERLTNTWMDREAYSSIPPKTVVLWGNNKSSSLPQTPSFNGPNTCERNMVKTLLGKWDNGGNQHFLLCLNAVYPINSLLHRYSF